MATVKSFIGELGGVTEVATRLAVPPTTIYTWSQKNSVPPWRKAKLAELAAERGIAFPAGFGDAA